MGKSSWTDDRIATLKQLWGAGKTAAEIANELGGVTRNAVIGKAHRLGLSGRSSPIQTKSSVSKTDATANRTRRQQTVRSSTPSEPVFVDPTLDKAPDGKGKSLLELNEKMCKWPYGDPKKDGFHFCGDRSVPGMPYCSTHVEMAYQGVGRKFAISMDEANGSDMSNDALAELDDALQG